MSGTWLAVDGVAGLLAPFAFALLVLSVKLVSTTVHGDKFLYFDLMLRWFSGDGNAFGGRLRVVDFVGIMLELESHLEVVMICGLVVAASTLLGGIGSASGFIAGMDLSALVSLSSIGTSSNIL